VTVIPYSWKDQVVCECHAFMHPIRYRAVGEKSAAGDWLYWACSADPLHVSCAVPLPEGLSTSPERVK